MLDSVRSERLIQVLILALKYVFFVLIKPENKIIFKVFNQIRWQSMCMCFLYSQDSLPGAGGSA